MRASRAPRESTRAPGRSFGGYDERTRVRRHPRPGHARSTPTSISTTPSSRPTDWDSGYADQPDPEESTGSYDLAERHALRRVAGPVDRARGHLRGRVPPAAPRARRAGGCLDRGHRGRRRELDGRAGPAGRDGRLDGARRVLPAPAEPRPRDVHRPRQGRGPQGDRAGHRRRHRDPRRRARAQPAQEPRGPGQGQGRRPDRADPRHLRPAREVQGGPGPGRARPAQLHEAAAARLGWQPVPPGRWPGRLAGRRHRWPWPR